MEKIATNIVRLAVKCHFNCHMLNCFWPYLWHISAANDDLSTSYCQLIVLCSFQRSGETNEQRCNMTCVTGGGQQAWPPFCKDQFQRVLATHRPPMNGTIGHFDNKQHILLEFSNSQQCRTELCLSIQGIAVIVPLVTPWGRRCVVSGRPTAPPHSSWV